MKMAWSHIYQCFAERICRRWQQALPLMRRLRWQDSELHHPMWTYQGLDRWWTTHDMRRSLWVWGREESDDEMRYVETHLSGMTHSTGEHSWGNELKQWVLSHLKLLNEKRRHRMTSKGTYTYCKTHNKHIHTYIHLYTSLTLGEMKHFTFFNLPFFS